MNINDLYVGQDYRLSKSFSEEDVILFSKLSLDSNPIHIDSEYAANSCFGKKIVHGFLSSSLISAIIGTKMPGFGSIYLKQELNFRKPIYIGETVTAIVKITDIRFEKSIVYLETKCLNEKGDVAVEGIAIIKLSK